MTSHPAARPYTYEQAIGECHECCDTERPQVRLPDGTILCTACYDAADDAQEDPDHD